MPRHPIYDPKILRRAWDIAHGEFCDINDGITIHCRLSGPDTIIICWGHEPVIELQYPVEFIRGIATIEELEELLDTDYGIGMVTGIGHI